MLKKCDDSSKNKLPRNAKKNEVFFVICFFAFCFYLNYTHSLTSQKWDSHKQQCVSLWGQSRWVNLFIKFEWFCFLFICVDLNKKKESRASKGYIKLQILFSSLLPIIYLTWLYVLNILGPLFFFCHRHQHRHEQSYRIKSMINHFFISYMSHALMLLYTYNTLKFIVGHMDFSDFSS